MRHKPRVPCRMSLCRTGTVVKNLMTTSVGRFTLLFAIALSAPIAVASTRDGMERSKVNAVLDVCASCAFTTIQGAINSVADADSALIRVAQGTYPETVIRAISGQIVVQGGWNASFSARSESPNLTHIVHSGFGVVAARAGAGQSIGLTLDGFKVSGASSGSYEIGGGVAASATAGGAVALDISNCLITENAASHGFGAGVGAVADGAHSIIDLTINRTRIVGNSITFYTGAGVYLLGHNQGTVNAHLSNTLVASNSSMYAGGIYAGAN